MNAARRVSSGLLAASVSLCGCGDDTPRGEALAGRELYALQTLVYQPDDSVSSYVAMTDTLDIDGELSLDDAREFPGYVFIGTVGNKLLVSSGDEPVITQYDVASNVDWKQTGRLSFANQGVASFGAGLERHWFLSENVAYLTLEVTSRIVWDPTAMELLEVVEDTRLEPTRDGLVLDAAFNRPPEILKGPVKKPFMYRDQDWFRFGDTTPIAVYDPETHAESSVVNVPCPALEVSSQDEDGNTYFSPWSYGPTLSLFGEGPATCIRRLTREGELDESWQPDLSTWTEGRPVHVLRYVSNGKAIASVLHVDDVAGDFTAGYDEELAGELEAHWRLWWFDLEAETAQPIEGIGSTGSGFSLGKLDGRFFVFVPNADWTATTIYEIGDDGEASARFDVEGIVNNWIRLR